MKTAVDGLRDLWDDTTFTLYGSQKEKKERKDMKNYLKR